MKPIKGGQHPGKSKDANEMLKQMADLLKGDFGKAQPNTSGIVYSKLLLDLITPYQKSKGTMPLEELEYLLDMGITAWNLAVYKKKGDFLYKSYLAAAKSADPMNKAGEKLLMKLVADKEKLFGQYNDTLLEDFEITENKKNQAVVNVYSKPFDSFIQESLNADMMDDLFEAAVDDNEDADDEDEEDDMPDYVLPVVNRNALMIKPRQPFLDWLRKIHFPQEPPQLQDEPNVYLLPEYETEKGAETYIKENFDRIFGSELWGWDIDEKNWPANRTYKMFKEWFDAKMQPMIYDMGNYPLEKD